jgi:hypothetical protein
MLNLRFLFLFYALFLAFLLYFNLYLLNYDPKEGRLKNNAAQRSHLKRAIHEENAAEQMQGIYPEGYCFTYALYALIWSDCILYDNANCNKQTAKNEMDYALQKLESDEGKAIFSPNLPLPYGAFYNGWLNYVRGMRLKVNQTSSENDPILIKKFEEGCDNIASAWQKDSAIYLESYLEQTWPADNILCLASLALHDQLFEPKYKAIINAWLAKIKSAEDPKTGLIPHSFSHATGRIKEGARGSSQSLMLCFLPEIDQQYALEKYELYQKYFLDYRLGLPSIREYPITQPNAGGDIDSGPVVFGIGGSASIVGVRALANQSKFQNNATSTALLATLEGLLIPTQKGEERRFLFGKLPILDIFLTWTAGNSSLINSDFSANWRLKFQIISFLMALPMMIFLFLLISTKSRTTLLHLI